MKTKNKILIGLIISFCFFCFNIFYFANNNYTSAQTSSSDAIAIKIITNTRHYSALEWYKQQGFKGAPQSTIVDGYEAVRDGRTVYVNVANVISGAAASNLYTNIYLISYNQEAEKETLDIFSKILSTWKFNYNVDSLGHCRKKNDVSCTLDNECALGDTCDSQKARIIRDTNRLAAISNIDVLMSVYYRGLNYYPKIASGSYLPRRTISVWPSWQDELGKALEGTLPIDPVNKIGTCPGYNADTCWNEETKRFASVLPDLPNNSLVYSYVASVDGTNYDFCAVFESGLNFPAAAGARTTCALPVCLDFDGDGYGRPVSSRCAHPEQDCDDSNNTVGGGSAEICNNGIDDDCDGFVDCGDSNCLGVAVCIGSLVCDADGACDSGEDCNNCPSDCGTCPVTCPNAVCSVAGNECNTCYDASGTVTSHSLDCYCGDGAACSSRGEQCDDGNNADNDGCSHDCRIETSTCVDNDSDGYDTCSPGSFGDDGNAADCNDNNSAVHPGAAELCDSIDNNCNGNINESFTAEQCAWVCTSLGFDWSGNGLPALNCCGNDANEGGPYQNIEANCSDGHDNNCNGLIDSGDANCGGGCNYNGENDWYNAANPSNCNQCTVNGDQEGDQSLIDWLTPVGIADTCDADCNTAMATTTTRTAYRSSENSIVLCTDGYDNDCDGLYNCADSDCQSTTACCANECTVSGARGCVDGTTRWECGNFDADPCLDRQEVSCGAQTCSGGICVAPCTDNDDDGYSAEGGGNCCGASGTAACGATADCNDANPYMYPGAAETCDGYNNDCDGETDEGCDDDGDGYCDSSMTYYPNWAVPPYLPIGSNPCSNTTSGSNRDCNDTSTAINPGSTEVCNGTDDNCNGSVDDSLSATTLCPLTQGVCNGIYQVCTSGAWVCNYGASYQAAETNCADSLDNDCDGLTDCADDSNCSTDPICSSCIFTFTLPCIFPE